MDQQFLAAWRNLINLMNTPPRRHRVVLCRGEYCNLGRRSDKLYPTLKQLVDEINADPSLVPCKLETANCLSLCGRGPNLIVYPEDAEFNALNDATLNTAVRDCLRKPLPE